MDKHEPFWKRAFDSVWRRLNRPVGGAKQARPAPEVAAEMAATPEPPVQAPPPKRRLWGQEFDVVTEGLAEDQVAAFVDDLMVKCTGLEEQQKHFLSLGALSEKAAIEADKAAAAIRARAKSEAEAEAARVIAEANQKTQEMMIEARSAAQEATQQDVQSILKAAIRKAAIIELQSKQQAQLFLIRSREAIESDLKEEVKEAYYRLISGLHNVLGEGNRLELEWRGRTGQLRGQETYELGPYEPVRSALGAEIARTPPLFGESGAAELNMANEAGERLEGS